jgi:hypothetical protein
VIQPVFQPRTERQDGRLTGCRGHGAPPRLLDIPLPVVNTVTTGRDLSYPAYFLQASSIIWTA